MSINAQQCFDGNQKIKVGGTKKINKYGKRIPRNTRRFLLPSKENNRVGYVGIIIILFSLKIFLKKSNFNT